VHPLLDIALRNAGMAIVLALFAAAAGSMCRQPALKHSLWLLVLLKLITPPIVGIPLPEFAWLHAATSEHASSGGDESLPRLEGPSGPWNLDIDIVPEDGAVETAAPSPVDTQLPPPLGPELPLWAEQETPALPAAVAEPSLEDRYWSIPWRWLVPVVWLSGSAWWFALTTIRIERFQRSLKYAIPASPTLEQQARELARRLGLTYCPAIWLVPGRISPLVWSLGSTRRLFLPVKLWERLNNEQQATLLAHELAHLRRRDHWVRSLELVVTGLYWWHPVVWWACRELREAEEQCCDAWVVWAFPDSARAYATALVETVDFLSETAVAVPAVASGFGHVHDLRRRLTMIMRGTTPKALSSVGLLAVLGLGICLLPLLPTQAQPPAKAAPQETAEHNFLTLGLQQLAEQQEAEDRGVRRAQEEVERLANEIQRMHAAEAEATQRLHRIKQEIDARQRQRASRDNAPDGALEGPRTRGSASDQDRRLRDVERKLDAVLDELRNLRRELRQSRRGGGAGASGGLGGPAGELNIPAEPALATPPRPPEPSPAVERGIAAVPTVPPALPEVPAPPSPARLPRRGSRPTSEATPKPPAPLPSPAAPALPPKKPRPDESGSSDDGDARGGW
jgi:bla regulator protein BlaR1